MNAGYQFSSRTRCPRKEADRPIAILSVGLGNKMANSLMAARVML